VKFGFCHVPWDRGRLEMHRRKPDIACPGGGDTGLGCFPDWNREFRISDLLCRVSFVREDLRPISFAMICGLYILADLMIIYTQHIPRLPYELIGHIAQLLQDEIDVKGYRTGFELQSLARLNRVSKDVHEITLPNLYRRTLYGSEHSITERIRPSVIPKGWQYVKWV
jgi:hypothetical protein